MRVLRDIHLKLEETMCINVSADHMNSLFLSCEESTVTWIVHSLLPRKQSIHRVNPVRVLIKRIGRMPKGTGLLQPRHGSEGVEQ